MGDGIDYYAGRFARLRTNRNRKVWSEVTAHQAAHKPILLLCVLDLFDSGEISSNLVEISDDLVELFGRYWERVLPFTRPGNLALPFFHLRGDGFWHLLPRYEGTLIGSQISSLTRLREEIVGACLDEDLYDLIRSDENRDRLRSVLIETYFSPEARQLLVEQSITNRGAYVYSEQLLRRPEDPTVQETLSLEEAYLPASAIRVFGGPSLRHIPIVAPCAASGSVPSTGIRLSRRRTSFRGARPRTTGPPTAWHCAGCATGPSMRGCSGFLRRTKSSHLGNSTPSITSLVT